MTDLDTNSWPAPLPQPPADPPERSTATWVRAGVAAIAVATLSVVGVNAIASRAQSLGDGGTAQGFPGAFPGGVQPQNGAPTQGTRSTRGTVTSVSGSTFTISTRNGGTRTITVTSSTDLQLASGPGSMSDIAVDAVVQVTGTSTGTNALDAITVVVDG